VTVAHVSESSALRSGSHRSGADALAAGVSLRPFPYPYKAALAICSDLDETPSAAVYLETARFLNTTEPTALGTGVGLEVGNTVYFDMAAGQFSYWNADDAGREAVRALIRSGHVDCLHSFGDLATTRAHAGRALDELARHDCALAVWVDHGLAVSNFGADIMQGQGDIVGSAAYHADLTLAFGIQYVWRGRVTSVVGQNAPRSLTAIASAGHPVASAVTLLKESAKGTLAKLGSAKYRAHGLNDLVWASHLRSGHEVWEFMRANPGWGGVSRHDTADGFAQVVRPPVLRALIERGGASILYTHLGKTARPLQPLDGRAREAWDRVAQHFHDGEILVTTTRRLLEYCRASRTTSWTAEHGGPGITVAVAGRGGRPAALDGLTFYLPDGARAEVMVDGAPVSARHNPPDHTGRGSVSIPWRRLAFPPRRV
jgi:hypothetical protein